MGPAGAGGASSTALKASEAVAKRAEATRRRANEGDMARGLVLGRDSANTGLLEVVEQGAEFAFGVFVLLVDGEAEGVLKLEAGFGFSAEFEVKFPEEDARHHPVGFLVDAEFVVLDGVDIAELGDEGLGEAEPEKFVVRLAGDQGGKGVRAPTDFAHGRLSTTTRTAVELSRPPRMLACSTISWRISDGCSLRER